MLRNYFKRLEYLVDLWLFESSNSNYYKDDLGSDITSNKSTYRSSIEFELYSRHKN